MTRRPVLPYLAVLGTVLIWGMSFVSSKTVLNAGVPPMTMVTLRFLVASAVLRPLLKLREPRTRLERGKVLPLLAGGVLGVTVYFFCESRGLQRTTASAASLITAVIPILTVVAERLLYHTRARWYRWVAVLGSVGGVYLLVGTPTGGSAAGAVEGGLFMLGACLAWVAYNMVSRNVHMDYSAFAATTYQSMFGALFLLPFALLEHRSWVPLTPPVILNVLYLALVSSALAYVFYVYALSLLGPVGVTPFINLIPLVGALAGVAVLGETVTALQLVGGAVTVAGVAAVSVRPRSEHPAHRT